MHRLVLPAEAALALAAFGDVERDDMIARLHAGHARPHLADHAGALMAEDRGEQALAVEPVERVGVGMADAGRHDLDQHLARLGAFEIELDDLERLLGREGDGGAGLHGVGSLRMRLRLPIMVLRWRRKRSDPAPTRCIVVGRVERGDGGVDAGDAVAAAVVERAGEGGRHFGVELEGDGRLVAPGEAGIRREDRRGDHVRVAAAAGRPGPGARRGRRRSGTSSIQGSRWTIG